MSGLYSGSGPAIPAALNAGNKLEYVNTPYSPSAA